MGVTYDAILSFGRAVRYATEPITTVSATKCPRSIRYIPIVHPQQKVLILQSRPGATCVTEAPAQS
jgi:hypothetical protein